MLAAGPLGPQYCWLFAWYELGRYLCDYSTWCSSNLRRHTRLHARDGTFSCQLCSYGGNTPAVVKRHHSRHHSNEIRCPEQDCQYTCKTELSMKKHHRLVHTAILPKYACHLCEKRNDTEASLSKHMTSRHSFIWPNGHSRFRYTKDETTGQQTFIFERQDPAGISRQAADKESTISSQ